jgi:hypothetical protein
VWRSRAGQDSNKKKLCGTVVDVYWIVVLFGSLAKTGSFMRVTKFKIKNMLAEYLDLSSESHSDSELEIYFSHIANGWCRITGRLCAISINISSNHIITLKQELKTKTKNTQ